MTEITEKGKAEPESQSKSSGVLFCFGPSAQEMSGSDYATNVADVGGDRESIAERSTTRSAPTSFNGVYSEEETTVRMTRASLRTFPWIWVEVALPHHRLKTCCWLERNV